MKEIKDALSTYEAVQADITLATLLLKVLAEADEDRKIEIVDNILDAVSNGNGTVRGVIESEFTL